MDIQFASFLLCVLYMVFIAKWRTVWDWLSHVVITSCLRHTSDNVMIYISPFLYPSSCVSLYAEEWNNVAERILNAILGHQSSTFIVCTCVCAWEARDSGIMSYLRWKKLASVSLPKNTNKISNFHVKI